jgi:hypothetical protein
MLLNAELRSEHIGASTFLIAQVLAQHAKASKTSLKPIVKTAVITFTGDVLARLAQMQLERLVSKSTIS